MIVVSVGPELTSVPGVIGLGEGDAIATLQGQGFEVNVQDLAANSSDEDGVVLDQDPARGQRGRARCHGHDLRRPLHRAGAAAPTRRHHDDGHDDHDDHDDG